MTFLPIPADRRLIALVIVVFYSIYFGYVVYPQQPSWAAWTVLCLVVAAGMAAIIQATVTIHRQKGRKTW
jgi:ABC-type multidrug transport system permease subunit